MAAAPGPQRQNQDPQQQRHPCPVCGSTFTRPQHVVRHLRSHTGERPYKCKECGDLFARSDLLSRHVNKCHPDVAPHTAGVPTKSSSRKKTCDQCTQSRTKCDSRIPCGNCVFHNIPCSRGSSTAEYVPSVSSQLYNHRASASTASLPELSGAHHKRRLSDSGSASSRGSYSTTGSVGNIGYGGIQLNETDRNLLNNFVPSVDLPSLQQTLQSQSFGHPTSSHHDRSSFDPSEMSHGYTDQLLFGLAGRDYVPRSSPTVTNPSRPASNNVSAPNGLGTDTTPLASDRRNPLESYAHPPDAYANHLNQNASNATKISPSTLPSSSSWFAPNYEQQQGYQQQQQPALADISVPNISSLRDGLEKEFSGPVPRDTYHPLYAYGSRNETSTATSVSTTLSGASSDYEYDGALGSTGDSSGRSSVLSNNIVYSNAPASQNTGSIGGVGQDGPEEHGTFVQSALPAMATSFGSGLQSLQQEQSHNHNHNSSQSNLDGTVGRMGGGGGLMADATSRELPLPYGMAASKTPGIAFPPSIRSSPSQLPSLSTLTSSSIDDTNPASSTHHPISTPGNMGAGPNSSDEERDNQRRLKDFWANWMAIPMFSTASEKDAFIGSTPGPGTTGVGNGAVNAVKTPAPGGASATMFQQFYGTLPASGGNSLTPGAGMGLNAWGGMNGSGSGGLGRVMSMPSIRTPTNEPGRRIGYGAGGESLITPRPSGIVGHDVTSKPLNNCGVEENLRKYHEACLAREPLALRLQPPSRFSLRRTIVTNNLSSNMSNGSGSSGHRSSMSPDSSNAGSPSGETNVSSAPTPASTYASLPSISPQLPLKPGVSAVDTLSTSTGIEDGIGALRTTIPPGPLAKSNMTGQMGDPRPSYKRLASHTLTQDVSKRATLPKVNNSRLGVMRPTSADDAADDGDEEDEVEDDPRQLRRRGGSGIGSVDVGMGMGVWRTRSFSTPGAISGQRPVVSGVLDRNTEQ